MIGDNYIGIALENISFIEIIISINGNSYYMAILLCGEEIQITECNCFDIIKSRRAE